MGCRAYRPNGQLDDVPAVTHVRLRLGWVSMAHAGTTRLQGLRIDRHGRAVENKWRLRLAVALASLLAVILVIATTRQPQAVRVVQIRLAQPGEAATELSAAGYVVSERTSNVAPKIPGG